jgi:hypothetical protein
MAATCFSHQITLTPCQVAGRMTRDLRGVTVEASQVRPVSRREIAHAGELAPR